jgi:hypothetical protein
MSDNELLEMAHTIMLRMAMRGGFDSYTGARLHEWLRRYDARPTKRAPDLAVRTCKYCDSPIEVGDRCRFHWWNPPSG